MSDPIEETTNEPSIDETKSDAPKNERSKLRWLWRGLGVFLILILLLIVFAPKIASTGFARSIIIPKINSSLDGGEVEISSWKFSWFGGQQIDGVRYLDESKATAIETNLISGLSLWDAIRGNLNLKETRLQANVNLKVDLDKNETNIDPVIKSKSKEKPEIVLPKLKGNITIELRGTIETTKNGEKGPAIFIEPSVIKLNVSDINQPIKIDTDLAMNVDGNPARLKLVGNADVIEKQLIISEPTKMSADMKATFEQVDLKIIEAIAPFIGVDVKQLEGIGNGTINLKLAAGSSGSVTSDVAFKNVVVQIPDREPLALDEVSMPLDVTITGADQQVTIKQAGIKSDLGEIRIHGDFPLASIDKLAKAEKADLPLTINADFSVPDVARVSALSGNSDESTKLHSGRFEGKASFASIPAKSEYEIKIDGAMTRVTLGEKLKNEDVKFIARGYLPSNLKKVSAWVDIFSNFGSFKITDTQLNLVNADGSSPNTLEMFDTINVSGSSDDLARVAALIQGFGAPAKSDIPPLKVESGKAAFGLVATRNDTGSIDLNVSKLSVTDLVARRGSERFAPDRPLTGIVKANLQVDPKKSDDVMDSIKKISVEALDIDTFGIASIKMDQPISIDDPLGKATATGAIRSQSDVAALDQMLVVLTGSKPVELAGRSSSLARFDTAGETIKLVLDGKVDQLRSTKDSQLPPQDFTFKGDINFDSVKKKIAFNQFEARTADGETLLVSMKGAITDWAETQQLEGVEFNLAYSLEKIWTLFGPMIDPENKFKIEAIAGDFKNQIFKLTGRLSDLKTLNGGGKIKLTRLYASGIDARDVDLWVTIKNGVVRFEDAKGGPTDDIVINSGKLKLAGITIDLAASTINAPDGHKLMSNVQVNPVLTNQLGKLTSVLFAESSRADGRLDVTILRMKNIPLDDFLNAKRGQGAKAQIDIRKFELDGMIPSLLAKAVDLGGSIRGEVRSATVEFAEGQSISDLTITLFREEKQGDIELPMRFAGKIAMDDFRLSDYTIGISKKLIKWKDLDKLPGEMIVVPVTGTINSPQFDLIGALVQQTQSDMLKNPGDFLEGIFNRDKDEKSDEKKSDEKKKSDDKSDSKKSGKDKPK